MKMYECAEDYYLRVTRCILQLFLCALRILRILIKFLLTDLNNTQSYIKEGNKLKKERSSFTR